LAITFDPKTLDGQSRAQNFRIIDSILRNFSKKSIPLGWSSRPNKVGQNAQIYPFMTSPTQTRNPTLSKIC